LAPALGLRANWRQFSLLVAVNGFVGSMVGLERSILPLIGEQEFGIASRGAILSFIVSFGLTKAVANLYSGRLGDRWGRRPVLLLGWAFGIPVPLLIMAAPDWSWVVGANVLLGINQGLCWTMTIISKIDLAGPARRGLAMGLNEFAGYVAVGATALATGYIAGAYRPRPEPFYLGLGLALAGLLLSLAVRETLPWVRSVEGSVGPGPTFRRVFALTSWRHRALFSASQAGLVNNLNDGVAWGLLPLFLAARALGPAEIGVIAAIYPTTWGLLQLATGALSDRVGRRLPIALGMVIQAAGFWAFALGDGMPLWVAAAVALGVGTALVYPTLLSSVADVADPGIRSSAVGVYRFWRDLGFAVGALAMGLLADLSTMAVALGATGGLTLLSGLAILVLMPETLRRLPPAALSALDGGDGRA
jgi:MFS family permease